MFNSFHRYQCDVKINNKFIIVSTTSRNFNHTPKHTNLYSSLFFYITFNMFVSSGHIYLLDCWSFTLYPSLHTCTLWRIDPNVRSRSLTQSYLTIYTLLNYLALDTNALRTYFYSYLQCILNNYIECQPFSQI